MVTNYRADTQYGVGHAKDAIVPVRSFGLPVPQAIYRPFQAVYSRGDITREGDGPPSVEWIWDVLYLEKLASLIRYIFPPTVSHPVGETLQFNKDIFVRTDKRLGWYGKPAQAFDVFTAIAWRPLLFGPDGTYAADTPYQVSTVRLTFRNLVEA